MKKLGAIMLTAALATTTAWAQMNNQDARKSGTQGSPGVVTGQSADGGIALRTDAAKARARATTSRLSASSKAVVKDSVVAVLPGCATPTPSCWTRCAQ